MISNQSYIFVETISLLSKENEIGSYVNFIVNKVRELSKESEREYKYNINIVPSTDSSESKTDSTESSESKMLSEDSKTSSNISSTSNMYNIEATIYRT